MMDTLHIQLKTFFTAFLSGVLLSSVFLLYEAFRQEFRIRGLPLVFMDILFWLQGAVVTFGLLLHGVQGRVRGYVFLAIALGWVLVLSLRGQCRNLTKGRATSDD